MINFRNGRFYFQLEASDQLSAVQFEPFTIYPSKKGKMSLLMRIVGSSVSIGNQAGNVIRSILLTGKLGIVDKADKNEQFDPQTEADRSAQNLIIGSLEKQFPGILVIGEEDDKADLPEDQLIGDVDPEVLKQTCPDEFKDLKLDELTVWVDPLDATKAFTEGNVENVTVLIGISARGQAIAGVIHQPFYQKDVGRTIWGVVGLGAFGITKQTPAPGRCIIITTKSHYSEALKESLDAFPEAKIVNTDGSGYKILSVIEGHSDAYLYPQLGTKRWDTCAPEAVLRSLGGTLTDSFGQDIDYAKSEKKFHMNWTGLVATLTNHDYFIEKIPERAKQTLKDLLASKM